MIVRARAPLRIDLAGGWTDVAPYTAHRGGAVVNVAVTLYAQVTVRTGGKGIRLRAVDLGAAVTAARAADLRADGELALLKAAARRYAPAVGAEITTHSDAPGGSGLGGSGALGVALVAALLRVAGRTLLPAEIAEAAFDTEVHDAGVLGGRQDQYAAALGGIQFLAVGEAAAAATRLSLPPDAARELERALVLCYTGASRYSDRTHRGVWAAYARGDAPVRTALDGLRQCALTMRTALERGDLGTAAATMSENWVHQQALAEGMRTDAMAALEAVGREAGADGVKACGAGAGGCLVFLARPGREGDVAAALEGARGTVLRFGFDLDGVRTWEAQER
jgi:D-glycero-alpha-D-manno-heptose-7-phosphate kinase